MLLSGIIMTDKDFIEQLNDLLYRYRMFRFSKRKTFKDFMEWVNSL